MPRGYALFAAIVSLGCAAPASAQVATPAGLPPEVVAQVRAAAPDMKITDAELKEREGRRYYDVEGVLPNGQEIELDLLQTPAGWTVVEIQRDIAWSEAPASAREVAAAAWKGPPPARVIESRQTDGAIIYELFAPDRPATPAMEVMLKNGAAKVLTETWPH